MQKLMATLASAGPTAGSDSVVYCADAYREILMQWTEGKMTVLEVNLACLKVSAARFNKPSCLRNDPDAMLSAEDISGADSAFATRDLLER